MSLHLHPLPTPITNWAHPVFREWRQEVAIKLDYLNHPKIQGNKLWKLWDVLDDFHQSAHTSICTFGGAFSNHLDAVNAVSGALQIPLHTIIRGEQPQSPSPTLRRLYQNTWAVCHFVPRSTYRLITQFDRLDLLPPACQGAYIIPEGGTIKGKLGGLSLLLDEITRQVGLDPHHIWVAAGTGGTAAGLLSHLPPGWHLDVVPVLKYPDIYRHITELADHPSSDRLTIHHGYEWGGYAKAPPQLLDFIQTTYTTIQVPLDPIYNAKVACACVQEIAKGYFPAGTRHLMLHTGGLQGIEGFNQRHGVLLPTL
jgi:1-aminocyclopropane-1-carboxylate deaminase